MTLKVSTAQCCFSGNINIFLCVPVWRGHGLILPQSWNPIAPEGGGWLLFGLCRPRPEPVCHIWEVYFPTSESSGVIPHPTSALRETALTRQLSATQSDNYLGSLLHKRSHQSHSCSFLCFCKMLIKFSNWSNLGFCEETLFLFCFLYFYKSQKAPHYTNSPLHRLEQPLFHNLVLQNMSNWDSCESHA